MMFKKFCEGPSRSQLAAFSLVLALACVCGCGKELDEVYPVEGNAYTQDPEYRGALRAQESERDRLTAERVRLKEDLDRLVEKYGDLEKAAASAEGASIRARILAGEAAFASNRLATAEIIRERVKRAVADSERIKRGEAKAKVNLKK